MTVCPLEEPTGMGGARGSASAEMSLRVPDLDGDLEVGRGNSGEPDEPRKTCVDMSVDAAVTSDCATRPPPCKCPKSRAEPGAPRGRGRPPHMACASSCTVITDNTQSLQTATTVKRCRQ